MSLLCTTCKHVLKSTDDIYSSNCGHIFHFVCMREFQSRSSCPECQHNKPTYFKMYLIFDQSKEQKLSNNWNDKLKILELHKQIEDNKHNCLNLQEKYSASQNLVRQLEGRIRKADNNISQRTVILSDLEDRLKTLEELNAFLAIDNECKSEALTLKSQEIKRLKITKTDTTASILNDEINKLEKKLKRQSMLLHQKIENCTKLSKDKTELQKQIDVAKLETNAREEAMIHPTEGVNKKETCTLNSFKSWQKLPQKQLEAEKLTVINRSSKDNISELQHKNKLDPKTCHAVRAECLEAQNGEIDYSANKTSLMQIIKLAKVKLIFKKFRERCLKFSSLFIFIVLMTNVITVD